METQNPRAARVRVTLPYHLRTLAHADKEVLLDLPPDAAGAITTAALLDALEARYPALAGAIRDHVTRQRRPMIRFFACEEDISFQPIDAPLPEPVAAGRQPFLIVGAIAGG